MKTHTPFFLFVILLLYTACQPEEADLGAASKYYPSADHLQNGIVNKYQTLFVSEKDKEIYEDIQYLFYQLSKEGQLIIKTYNIAGELSASSLYTFEDNVMLHKNQYVLSYGDSLVSEIHQATYKHWKLDTINYQKNIVYEWGNRETSIQQLSLRDTMVLNKPAKLFSSKQTMTNFFEQDTTVVYFSNTEIFVAGLGLFQEENKSEYGQFTRELIAQLSLEDFEKITKHNRHRVAYIDPTTVIDKGSDFQLCETQDKILDYYNGQPDAGFNGGKGAIKRAILSKLDTSKLYNESGFLTFRFVINCEGKVGWFTTEQADLDYQKKQFNPATVQHFYEIISQLTTWHPTVIREQSRDAYAYLTIKLKDGTITDFLP